MDKEVLSIIVPCYNVESYITKCLTSIVNQTYQNLEILLIDDGSTDRTPILCDSWEKSDSRIRVIHQYNKGLPGTRRTGINNITGSYVTFVDSDDYILPDMYSKMMSAMIRENVDIAQCGVFDVFEDGRIKHRFQKSYDSNYEVYSHRDGFFKIIEDKEWRSYMWNKIYKKHLFKNVEFPQGRGLDEDVSVMHLLFHNAQGSIYFKDEYYGYLHRSSSICNNNDHKAKMKKVYDRTRARMERYHFVAQHPEYTAIMSYLRGMTVSFCIAGLRNVAKSPEFFPNNYFEWLSTEIRAIRLEGKEYNSEYISTMKKIEIIYLKLFPKLYKQTIPFIYKYLK